MTLAQIAPAPARAAPIVTELDRLKRREPGAWTAVFEREYPLVFRTVLIRVREQAVAEDIAAQVFLEAIEGYWPLSRAREALRRLARNHRPAPFAGLVSAA